MKRHLRPAPVTGLAPALQQCDRTFVLDRGRKLIYFAGCDYFRLSSHPVVLDAVRTGIERYGLNVAASRKTTGNHILYGQLEADLATFFRVEAAVLVSCGYFTNLAVAQALAGEFSHALIDERSHSSLFDAAKWLGCRVESFRHRDTRDAAIRARRSGRRGARLLLITDGLFSHSGEVAPLDDYLHALPSDTTFLVDDAHGAGVLGRGGRGTAEHLGVATGRLIQTVTLSKAFGAYGGAILGPRQLRTQLVARSRIFAGNTPVPLPMAAGARVALKLLRHDPGFRQRLALNTGQVKAAIRESGLAVNEGPGPIVPIIPHSAKETVALQRSLLKAGIHPPYINYLGGPADGYFRFVLSSEHTAEQLARLVAVLRHFTKSRTGTGR